MKHILVKVLVLAGLLLSWAYVSPSLADALVTGRVETDSGEGAVGYALAVKAVSGRLSGKTFSAFADDNGNYQLYLPAGEYRILPVRQPDDLTQNVLVLDGESERTLQTFRLR